MTGRILALTALAMVAFAGNSVLNRLALAAGEIGPVSFTLMRVCSGAAILFVLARPRPALKNGSWAGAAALLIYALGFSLAYIGLDAGIGALILFGCVQVTMVGWGLVKGDRLAPSALMGMALALAGLVWLVSPTLGTPNSVAAGLMAMAGVAWGAYSLLGRGESLPTASTAGNFWRAAVMALPGLAIWLWVSPEMSPSLSGILLALASGTLTSGLGYAVWYAALPGLSPQQAGTAQLSVPVIAALGGAIFIAEPLTLHMALSGAVVLGGVALVLSGRRRSTEGQGR